MTGAEYGFLLLTSKLGNPDRKPLTVAQFRELFVRSEQLERKEGTRNVTAEDLVPMGYGPQMAAHIVELLGEEMLLQRYLQRAKKAGCVPITRATECYPVALRNRLGLDSPGVLWAKGDLDLLGEPAIALVGSRALRSANREFAKEVGRQVAKQGLTLVSGNARGADQTAQDACLEAGGKVISVVADSLEEHSAKENVLYLSEDVFDGEFSAQRALSRNRVIHCLGIKTFVAQSNLEKGGTWDGTAKNLQRNWSSVFCYDDRSSAAIELHHLGAKLIDISQLADITGLQPDAQSFL
ncbi:MAG: DNA-protecting protein DprA [Oscillospiraceae bacterium]|nr:DNA-protecting protein DprA [Oscillospiraceae bacterium]